MTHADHAFATDAVMNQKKFDLLYAVVLLAIIFPVVSMDTAIGTVETVIASPAVFVRVVVAKSASVQAVLN